MSYRIALIHIAVAVAVPTLSFAEAPRTCTVRELNEIRFSPAFPGDLLTTGTVQKTGFGQDHATCTLADETGSCFLKIGHSIPIPDSGALVEVVCQKERRPDHDKLLMITSLSVIGTGRIFPPIRLSLSKLDDRRHDSCTIETEGIVVDVCPDEISTDHDVLLLKDGTVQIPLFIPASTSNAVWTGTRIRVIADYHRLVSGKRRFSGPYLTGNAADIRIVKPPVADTDIPSIDPGDYLTPTEVAAMDLRSVEGTVLATWGGDNLMLDVSNIVVNASLSRNSTLPEVGKRIRLVGYPETDLYKLNLVKARWSLLAASVRADAPPILSSVSNIIRTADSKSAYRADSNGKLVQLSGIVQSCPAQDGSEQRLSLDVEGRRVLVDISSCPLAIQDVSVGCKIEVTGRCLMEIAPWRQYDVFPQIKGFAIIARSADDIKILKHPPWWTPNKLFGLVIALVLLLIGTVIWNRFLNHLVERRGRQLYRADIERAGEALRVEERTRLAVELHDSLSQNLTGVALQINAGRNELAARALRSCRDELRNCLWDLRNNAIDCASMDEAIRQTLEPHVEDITLNVRFNVQRTALSDNTAYAILRIIRELVVNAIRHGGAANVRIAGSLEPERLLFSVRDDGCGFDPGNRPGITEGHFGLQGVSERVASLGGEISFESHPGEGTKVVIVLPVSKTTTSQKLS